MVKEKQYVRIFHDMITDGLSKNDLLVYAYIHSYTSRNQECYSSQITMSKYLHIDRTTVYRAIKSLLQSSMIEKSFDGEKIKYKANKLYNDGQYFDYYGATPGCINGNESLVYCFIQKNRHATEKLISDTLNLCIDTVVQILRKLQNLKLYVKEVLRSNVGRFVGVVFRKPKEIEENKNSKEKLQHPTLKDTTSIVEDCNTYTKTNTNLKYIKQKSNNKFNKFELNNSYDNIDWDKFEQELLCH